MIIIFYFIELSELQKRLYKAILIKDFSAFKNKKNTRLLNCKFLTL